ncbi:MAG: SGNH/GDSL hydrolase family protein, partial [Candidatus Omnitrophica bacterium]|nr:SGNH/GDSL hydrolase family protein [Candidatus Omnitrophota bacterium]
DERGIPMILVAYPYGIYVGADEWNEGRFTWGFEKDRLYTDHLPFEIIGEYADSRGIPYINTTPKLIEARREADEPFFYNWDGHMTPAAHKVVASEIATNPFLLGALRKMR